ncbi:MULTISPECIES: DUF4190 domain-containing protein [unclassified Gordonia (in: high G+C Gram-positive bacteria)]|uniref:DUF4190 domain-containing protein n=1 Tax=Gordonia sp. B7-2 TaxID=3420932 RepID=UPI003D8EC9DA
MTNPTGDDDPFKKKPAEPESYEPPATPSGDATRVIKTGPGEGYPPQGSPSSPPPPSYGTPQPPAGGYDATRVSQTPPPSYGSPSTPSSDPSQYGAPPSYGAPGSTPSYGAPGSTPSYGASTPSYGADPGASSDPNVPPSYGTPSYGTPPASPYGQPGYGASGYPAAGAPGYPAQAKNNPLAIASLVCSIVGLVCCGLTAIVGLVLGIVARKQIKESNGTQTGDGMALAGIIIGAIVTVLFIIYWILVFAGVIGSFAFDTSTDY